MDAINARVAYVLRTPNMLKILYICTHNRCRSILSEAITNHLASDVITAKSAGSEPAGQVHPLTLKYLEHSGIASDGLKSQSWDEFADYEPDVVITVCDKAVQETCPVWFGQAIQAHWNLEDPSKIGGSEAEIEQGFIRCMARIKRRVEQLRFLASQKLEGELLAGELEKLGANIQYE